MQLFDIYQLSAYDGSYSFTLVYGGATDGVVIGVVTATHELRFLWLVERIN